MDLFIPLIYFILTNGLFVLLFNKSFGKCIPITLIISTFTLYISQFLFKTFNIGVIINILFPFVFLLLIFIKRKKENVQVFYKNFFSNGFYIFLVIYICIYIFDFYRVFTKWDEFSHWGVMVKEMYRLDRFYSVKQSTLMVHKDYPPIIQLFEFFYSKLCGGYKEAYLERAIHLLNLSFFIPLFSEKEQSKKQVLLKTLLITISIFMIYLLFDRHNIINTIYVDYTMAITTAYLLATISIEKDLFQKFTIINLSLGLTFLLLIKQMSLPLYAMILFLFIMNILLKEKGKRLSKENLKKLCKIAILLIIIPILTMKSWNCYIEKLKIEKQFDLKDIKIMELKNINNGTKGEKYQQQSIKNYFRAIKTENMTTSYLHITYLECFIITIVLLYVLWSLNKKTISKQQIILIGITLTLGYIGYSFVMLILYVFSFGPIEGPSLASFERYMPTFVLICLSLIFMLFIYNNKTKKDLHKLVMLTAILILIQSPLSINKCYPRIKKSQMSGFEKLANSIKEKTKNKSKIYVIAEDSVGDYQFYIKYYLGDKTTNLVYFDLPVKDIENYEDYYNQNIKEYMLKFDYLFLAKLNKEFKEKYSFLFENNTIEEGNLYKIEKYPMKLIK